MRWHEFIFSDQPAKRSQRHSAFWFAWWLYLSFCEHLYQLPVPGTKMQPFYVNVGPVPYLKTLLLIAVYASVFYTVIFLFRQFAKTNLFKTVLFSLSVTVVLYAIVYHLFWNAFPYIDSISGSANTRYYAAKFWPVFSLGLIAPVKIFAFATIIKYVKNWWLKQKESEQLEREKINAELQLLRVQMQPEILFTTLNHIYDYSKNESPHAPELLLRLSDLLSYMLYECEEQFVSIQKELEMMKGYIAMEKLRNDRVEVEVNVKNDGGNKMIAPFLLLPFIEYSFRYSTANTEQAWINMDISIEDNVLNMKLAHSIASEQISEEQFSSNGMANVKKRLNLIYPQQHELRITHEGEMMVIFLNIQMRVEAVETNELSFTSSNIITQSTMYVAQ